jgi:hypothetical protein
MTVKGPEADKQGDATLLLAIASSPTRHCELLNSSASYLTRNCEFEASKHPFRQCLLAMASNCSPLRVMTVQACKNGVFDSKTSNSNDPKHNMTLMIIQKPV